MKYLTKQIVFREIPEEISLSYLIVGCPLRCKGCHSSDSWDSSKGKPLANTDFAEHLKQYKNWITCVLFMGGEWHPQELIELLTHAHNQNLKTALYSGRTQLDPEIIKHLDYLKTGPYIQHLGGLDSITTNQKLIDLKNDKILNAYFVTTKEEQNDLIGQTAT